MRPRTIALATLVGLFAVFVYWFETGNVQLRTMQGDPVSWLAFDLQKEKIEQQNFDFIVVGAGVTGSVIGSRLYKMGHRVLVLEKGGPDVYNEDLFDLLAAPSQFSKHIKDSRFSWNYESTEQPSLNGRKVFIPQAKVYGGSGVIAPLIVHSPSKQYFDDWKVNGWDADQLHKIFDVVRENISIPVPEPHKSTLQFVNAAKSLGLNENSEEGFGISHIMQFGSRRWSTSDSHLKNSFRWSARKDKTLKHVIGAHVTKVLFNDNKVATGVEFVDASGKKHIVSASKEVVLCAGAINTPQILLLSGIGSKEQLTTHGIQVVLELPSVGKNLQEQVAVPIVFESKLPSLQTEHTLTNEAHWILFGDGPLTSPVFEAAGLVKSQPSLQNPDIQLIVAPAYYDNHQTNFSKDALTVLVTVPQPQSKGTVELASSDPFVAPKINPNFLGEQRDVQALTRGLEIARNLAQATKNAVGDELLPGRTVEGASGLLKHVQEHLMGLFFPAGTCRMGSDSNAVVDENLLVKGVSNLRIVDASVLPSLPAGSPYLTLFGVAEKAAVLISQKYK